MAVLMCAVLLAALVGLACTKSSTDKEAQADATSRPATATQPTEESLALNEYLVQALQIDRDMSRRVSEAIGELPNPQQDPQAFITAVVALDQSLSASVNAALALLERLTPPAEATTYHRDLLAVSESLSQWLSDLSDALDSRDETTIVAAFQGIIGILGDLGPIAEEAQQLTIRALQAKPASPLRTYLIDAATLRASNANLLAELSERLQPLLSTGNTDDVIPLVEDLIERLTRFQDAWGALEPPPEAQALHERQAEGISASIALEEKLLTAFRDQDVEALLTASQSSIALSNDAALVSAGWTDLLIQELSAP
ncbi:MAG: hypothetical protein WEB04_04380 [Dehalococcoidia bacterium]